MVVHAQQQTANEELQRHNRESIDAHAREKAVSERRQTINQRIQADHRNLMDAYDGHEPVTCNEALQTRHREMMLKYERRQGINARFHTEHRDLMAAHDGRQRIDAELTSRISSFEAATLGTEDRFEIPPRSRA
jgi:hypothetical protein